jgi:hypothetical protein
VSASPLFATAKTAVVENILGDGSHPGDVRDDECTKIGGLSLLSSKLVLSMFSSEQLLNSYFLNNELIPFFFYIEKKKNLSKYGRRSTWV